MKRKKERFRIISERDNVLEPGKELFHNIKGQWNTQYFDRAAPLTLELACGRGEYSIQLAEMFPEKNFVGVDIKGDRIWKGSTWAVERNLKNVAFLRTHILMIENFFETGEVNEIWITFPDPRPKKKDIKRRLTSPRFIDMYKNILERDGYVRLKTDNTGLFEYTLEELKVRTDISDFKFTADVYDSSLRTECFEIKTRYEEMFAAQGEKIKYLRFKFIQ